MSVEPNQLLSPQAIAEGAEDAEKGRGYPEADAAERPGRLPLEKRSKWN